MVKENIWSIQEKIEQNEQTKFSESELNTEKIFSYIKDNIQSAQKSLEKFAEEESWRWPFGKSAENIKDEMNQEIIDFVIQTLSEWRFDAYSLHEFENEDGEIDLQWYINTLNNWIQDLIEKWSKRWLEIKELEENLSEQQRELIEFFDIPAEVFAEGQFSLDEYAIEADMEDKNLSLEDFLSRYKNYIEDNLSGADQKIVSKIKESIANRATLIWEKVSERIQNVKDNHDRENLKEELKRERWNVNRDLNDL